MIKRREEKEVEKEKRRLAAETPEGRARKWLTTIQDSVSKALEEAKKCQDGSNCLPGGLRKEYASSWNTRATTFKTQRKKVEEAVTHGRDPQAFGTLMDKAEAAVDDFKTDLSRYKTLERGYAKTKVKKTAGEGGDA